MADDIELVARLVAYERGKAMPIASHLQVAIRPDALVLCPIAMAGEDTTVHIVALGGVGQPAQIRCVADPRVRDLQYELFEWLGERIERHFEACRRQGTYPQLWVSSGAAADHLDTLADRLRYNRDTPAVRRCGELLSYHAGRYPVAGQQALVTATAALRSHWATGQQPGEDEHLGALLAWVAPPRGVPIQDAVAQAELVPMGVKTDPEFDRKTLEPAVTRFNEARRAKTAAAELRRRAAAVEVALTPVVSRVYEVTQRAITLLRRMNLPPLPGLRQLEEREIEEFEFFMRGRDEGRRLALRDTPRAAAFGLTVREDAEQTVRAALVCGDRVARARALLRGDVVRGEVRNVRTTQVGPRRVQHTFDLLTAQRVLHIRRRDELCWIGDPRLQVLVADVQRRGATTRVSVEVLAGQRAVGVPSAGETFEFTRAVPDWGWAIRVRLQLAKRLATTPWTHRSDGIPAEGRQRRPPPDPLAAIEALR